MKRKARIERTTLETRIALELNLDGRGEADLKTGIPFLEHMLALWCRHGFFDLAIEAGGDLEVEPHHLMEDIGICLGRAWSQALGGKEGIRRYGFSAVPMDDALVMAAVDLSGRPYLVYSVELPPGPVGSLDPELFKEFWQAFVNEGRFNFHARMLHGENKHHIVEALFKAAGRAMNEASSFLPGQEGVLSTKGTLE
ncbi:MAG TPA: imidazoleglycerol-phosphate dehydratase HisB [Bacillota bacterium]|jgi:imidazoleglycerol-phosphate dehydratase|nr:imidazoleglycerol-phosphate dehydratase HisB [Bacillota bacterium]HOB86742.1 imidazoleglycerol-phosphate dehydratase HisB [Bacillota bacterium]HOP69822.1 imidazoleglycerol-phosphate dehydratase HisB [Bacillota bacterium]HPT34819.1 imidazoleglycerol-phosphate dehydratase HisB [Bacillota bacterium]HPZ64613.1 imidazoleglycerol-phosphate dehydratase HisB [Bacillota bacterium]